MSTKVCNKCKEERDLSQYGFESRSGKIKTICKVCQSNYNKQRVKYKRDNTIKRKTCKKCTSEKSTEEFSDNYLIKDGISNVCKKCCVEKSKEYKYKNEDKISKYQKDYKKENVDKIKNYNENYKTIRKQKSKVYRINYFSDPVKKLSKKIRDSVLDAFKRSCNGTYKKSKRTEEILCCTIPELIEYLQSLFTEGMTLENHGNCEECWHIDHKIPLALAETEEEIIKLNHYTNLQPLWRSDNLSKGKKIN